MGNPYIPTPQEIIGKIRAQAAAGNFRITQHAHQEMTEEDIRLDDLVEAIDAGRVLENYPEHRRGACCLVNGITKGGRPLHIICTATKETLIIITVYEPKPPKWISATQRRG